ncbi:MAG TPA: hypothetical protein VN653_03135, partial [Anaerolineales bacterium]|nr:hypothetical protein [Anaerolineales bacterium]
MTEARKYELYSKEFRKNSHAVFAGMRANDPIYKQTGLDGRTLIWFVTRYEDAQQVLFDDAHFVLDPKLVYDAEELKRLFGESDPQIDNMLNRDGEDHRRLRSLVSKAFTPRVIQSMRPRIEAIAKEL